MIDQNFCQSFNILDNLPGGAYICEMHEPLSACRVIYANRELLRMFECETMQEFMTHVSGHPLNMVPAEDIPRVEKTIARQIQQNRKSFSHILMRIITCLGRARFVELSGRFMRGADGKQLLYCLITDTERRPSGTPIDKEVREYVIHHIDDAIKNCWVQVYYQPVVRTLTGNLCGFEALARWIDPQIGFLSPIAFIPALEQTQQIHKLDLFILEEICRTIKERISHDKSFVPISFNLSRLDFATLDVFRTIETMVNRYDLPRDMLHIEVTESTLARDPGMVQETINRLRDAGYEVWLDDFGSSYSSLNILKDCNLDLIKLDMGFLRTFTKKSREIIASTIDMAKKLGIKTLTEGVETKEQADFLTSIGCGRLQGYYFGKPQPLEGALAHIKAQGRQLESRKWHHYYDKASSVITETTRPIALIDFAENRAHYLYTNEAYRTQLQGLNYDLQRGEDSLNNPQQNAIYDTFREFLQLARISQKREVYFYVDGGNYVRIYFNIVLELNGHTLVMTELKNITQNRERLEHVRFDVNLRYLYMLFDMIYIIDLDHDTLEPLFMHESFAHDTHLQKRKGLKQIIREFSEKHLLPEDRLRYIQFCNPDNLADRLAQSPDGRIYDCFRFRNDKGNYTWKECAAALAADTQAYQVITTVQSIKLPSDTLRDMNEGSATAPSLPAGQSLAALLWKNLQQNSHLCYFWKDNKRRFVGASKAFLDAYGFASEEAILGKTDEDMGWHVDNVPYYEDEVEVLQKGRVIEKAPGQCIIRGVLHHIACYKWPLYKDGQIIGLMGLFFDTDALIKEHTANSRLSYLDPLTGLMNHQGLLDVLMRYEEQDQIYGRPYTLILLSSLRSHRIAHSYGDKFLKLLIQKEAACLRILASKDSSIARVTQSMFAIVRYKNKDGENEALTEQVLQKMESIHQIEGNPVTVTIEYSIVHSDEPGICAKNIYAKAVERLQTK